MGYGTGINHDRSRVGHERWAATSFAFVIDVSGKVVVTFACCFFSNLGIPDTLKP